MTEYVKIKDAAYAFCVSRSYVLALIKAGLLPYRVGKGIPKADFDQYNHHLSIQRKKALDELAKINQELEL